MQNYKSIALYCSPRESDRLILSNLKLVTINFRVQNLNMALRNDVDPNGLLEYSVVYTDRSLNHMSAAFQQVMNDISAELKQVYNTDTVVVVPGGGTYGMEAVARQLAADKHTLIIRNGWFSYRWTQILERGQIHKSMTVLKAQYDHTEKNAAFRPFPLEQAITKIKEEKPSIVFMPHVETSAGMILPDEYIRSIADAVHDVNGILVLDCIASGAIWIDMVKTGVDILISAPQKGWSSTPCAGIIMMNEKATVLVDESTSSSFSNDLKQWLKIMKAYENGGHAYHATMPTDGLRQYRDAILEAKKIGFDTLKDAQWNLGNKIRVLLHDHGYKSVAADVYTAPSVVVSYTEDERIHKGKAFAQHGVQIAAGVPLACDEPEAFKTFRLGLFGLDKLKDVDGTVQRFAEVLRKL